MKPSADAPVCCYSLLSGNGQVSLIFSSERTLQSCISTFHTHGTLEKIIPNQRLTIRFFSKPKGCFHPRYPTVLLRNTCRLDSKTLLFCLLQLRGSTGESTERSVRYEKEDHKKMGLFFQSLQRGAESGENAVSSR